MEKTEILKIVKKDLLEFFDAKTLLINNQVLMELCIDSTLKAINYTRCCSKFPSRKEIRLAANKYVYKDNEYKTNESKLTARITFVKACKWYSDEIKQQCN